MAAIIITIILNLLVGTPSDKNIGKDQQSTTGNTDTIRAHGGTGNWTNTDK